MAHEFGQGASAAHADRLATPARSCGDGSSALRADPRTAIESLTGCANVLHPRLRGDDVLALGKHLSGWFIRATTRLAPMIGSNPFRGSSARMYGDWRLGPWRLALRSITSLLARLATTNHPRLRGHGGHPHPPHQHRPAVWHIRARAGWRFGLTDEASHADGSSAQARGYPLECLPSVEVPRSIRAIALAHSDSACRMPRMWAPCTVSHPRTTLAAKSYS